MGKSRLRVVPHFYSRIVRASETRARVKISPRKKRRHAAGREKNEGLQKKAPAFELMRCSHNAKL